MADVDPNVTSDDSLSDEQADQIFENLRAGPAVMSKEDVYTHEETCKNWDVWRRAAFASLTMPGGEMIEKVETDRETAVVFADLMRDLKEYREHLDGLSEVVKTAETRLMVALCCREDMQSIFEELDAKA